MIKDINEEINRLLEIKKDVEKINKLRSEKTPYAVVSQDKYNMLSDEIKMSGLAFAIVTDDIAEYIESDSVILEDDKAYVFRNGECVHSVDR